MPQVREDLSEIKERNIIFYYGMQQKKVKRKKDDIIRRHRTESRHSIELVCGRISNSFYNKLLLKKIWLPLLVGPECFI